MKASRSKAKGGHTKSLHIKLPADHPIFSFPEGERSRVAREWLEQGRQVLATMEEIKRDIAAIKKNLSGSVKQRGDSDKPKEKNNRNSQTNPIDPAVFLGM